MDKEMLLSLLFLEEEEVKKKKLRRWCVRPLNRTRLVDGELSTLVKEMRSMDAEKHFQYFRMSALRFDDLLHRIAPYLQQKLTHRAPVGAAERLAVTLRFLATGSSHQSIAASYRLGTRTVSKIVPEVCQAIWECLQPEYVAVPSQEKWVNIAQDFWRMWNFPLCVGALDGKHVQIRAPPNAGSDFFNYKVTRSIVLMAACDAQYRFTMVDIGAYGRDSDGGVFKDSEFGAKLMEGTLGLPPPAVLPGTDTLSPYTLVGDAAFPLHTNLMRPYPGTNLIPAQQVYNYRHCRAKRIIENAFGILASRWRVFGRPIDCSVTNTVHIVKACVALHNFLAYTDAANPGNNRYIPTNYTDSTNTNGDLIAGEWRRIVEGDNNLHVPRHLSANRATRAALLTRKNLETFFQTSQGSLPWQDRVVRRGLLGV